MPRVSARGSVSQLGRVGTVVRVSAIQQVRRMRGWTQSHLMLASDSNFYVVKFMNNPQHVRCLANEMLAALLARIVQLPVPEPAIVDVSEWLVEHTPDLTFQLGTDELRCQPGIQFGSRHVGDSRGSEVLDFIPKTMLGRVSNLNAFVGMLVMDKWTGNVDKRQAVFSRKRPQTDYTAAFIDQGHCFNGGEWNFPDSPLRGIFWHSEAYAGVDGWLAFEPWLSRIEGLSRDVIMEAADSIPPEWYGNESGALNELVKTLFQRREEIRSLLTAFRLSSLRPFPQWVDKKQSAA